MNLSIALFLSLLSVEGVSAPVAGSGVNPVPGISFASESFSLGKIQSGSFKKFQFDFKNTGNAVLIINEIKASCGCTEATPSQKEIPPGAGGAIKVTFDSHGFQGQVKKEIKVWTNDPRHPETELKFDAQVLPTLLVEPKNIDYGTLSIKTARPKDVIRYISFKDMMKSGTRVLTVQTDLPFLRVRIVKVQRNETIIKAELVSPRDFRGDFQGLVKILSDSKLYPVLLVLVQGRIKD